MIKMTSAAVGIVVAGAVFFLYTQPAYDSVRALKVEAAEYDQALNRAAELQQLKQSLLSRYNAFNPADLDRLRKLLPDHVDNVRLVLDLDNLAARHGMALQNVVISNPQGDTRDQNNVASNIIATSRQKYDSLTLKFSTVGTYANFMAFLQDLETSLRIVDLTELSLEQENSIQAEGAPGGGSIYRYQVTIRTYWLK